MYDECRNQEINGGILEIDKFNNLQEELINRNIGSDIPSAHVECEGIIGHKASLLK